jgi:lysophospholipase L1-like esterase
MSNQKVLSLGLPGIPEQFSLDTCPYNPGTPGSPTSPGDNPSKCFGSEGTTDPPLTFVQRILPLGASITWGQGSTTGNGYRENLREIIVAHGGKVNYVGSRQSGTMNDSDVEGTQGAIISGVAKNAEHSLPYKPNIVLINAGTNDCTGNVDVPNAHLRMGAILDRILSAIPGVVVIMSTLIPNTLNPGYVATYNANLKTMVAARKAAGERVTIVDMQGPGGLTTDDIHPGKLISPL